MSRLDLARHRHSLPTAFIMVTKKKRSVEAPGDFESSPLTFR